MIIIKQCGVRDIIGNPRFPALRDEYIAECAVAGLPNPSEKLALYEAMQGSGALTLFGAFAEAAGQGGKTEGKAEGGTELVGFVAVLAPVLPHYGVVVAVTESLFVARDYRKSGAGLALIRRAESHGKDVGSPGLLLSAPCGGRLERLLPRIGYRATNTTFFKGFIHEY